ncbi:hydroxymethylbilane synthase [Mesonia mobilis]|uniref:Hydroxymethylbilane synthase n=1 Tax=Mesonia mobilis TaxID=369791 RepID=A0ABQ3BFX9_9FLAO|nr:hydroxymethylbilane synthase [Mesonia mobilis]MBQ0738567.1 hydroxymethylbilane synthase [Aquimarina celericrescens]GGZ43593.1 hydroxymethylbilane synthase [Mesonia mobilis]
MSKTIRIGTRDSELALWQANTVKNKLEALGYQTKLLPVKSTGDLNLDQPLYEMGITGIFTKTLDVAMVKDQIDIAVHSMKDVPTKLPNGIVQGAVLPRANVSDILIHKGLDFLAAEGTIATGSLRRKAQWLNRYPTHQVENLRGNVNTRLQKLEDNDWNGAIFAAAGLERINLKPENFIDLDWMIPAPAQGAMLIVAKENDDFCKEAVAQLNDKNTAICVEIEREFLRVLEGGCTAPIGALATITNETVEFTGALFSLDGKTKLEEKASFSLNNYKNQGEKAAKAILSNGGKELMANIKAKLNA